MSDLVTIQHWPDSQQCMGCKHGEYMLSKIYDTSNYICLKAYVLEAGNRCPRKEPSSGDSGD